MAPIVVAPPQKPAPAVGPVAAAARPVPRPLSGSSERRSDLLTRPRYTNTLPDLTFDTKFIAYPFDHNRFVTYSTTSLERNYMYDVLTEPDLGVDVELVIPNAYNVPANHQPHLDPKDEKLLEEEVMPQKNQKRSRHHAKSVSWLRRTEYISTEQTRFQPQTIDKVESKVGYSIKKKMTEEWHYSDRAAQIKAIEKTFEDARAPINQHFSKPGVEPQEILPVFPDFHLWKYPCAQVIFDSDPAPVGRPIPAQLEEMSQAMIRGVMDESGEQFVAYFLPTEETLEKRRRDQETSKDYVEDEVYEYRMAREYNWNVKSKATKGYEENYFFVIRDSGVYYNELETRVRLNKRRTRGQNQQLNTKLCVRHVPLAYSDTMFQKNREKELEPIVEEEEEVNEIEDEQANKSDAENAKSADEENESSSESEDEDAPPKKKERESKESSESESDSDKSVKDDKAVSVPNTDMTEKEEADSAREQGKKSSEEEDDDDETDKSESSSEQSESD